jgi:hypothetical protein
MSAHDTDAVGAGDGGPVGVDLAVSGVQSVAEGGRDPGKPMLASASQRELPGQGDVDHVRKFRVAPRAQIHGSDLRVLF